MYHCNPYEQPSVFIDVRRIEPTRLSTHDPGLDAHVPPRAALDGISASKTRFSGGTRDPPRRPPPPPPIPTSYSLPPYGARVADRSRAPPAAPPRRLASSPGRRCGEPPKSCANTPASASSSSAAASGDQSSTTSPGGLGPSTTASITSRVSAIRATPAPLGPGPASVTLASSPAGNGCPPFKIATSGSASSAGTRLSGSSARTKPTCAVRRISTSGVVFGVLSCASTREHADARAPRRWSPAKARRMRRRPPPLRPRRRSRRTRRFRRRRVPRGGPRRRRARRRRPRVATRPRRRVRTRDSRATSSVSSSRSAAARPSRPSSSSPSVPAVARITPRISCMRRACEFAVDSSRARSAASASNANASSISSRSASAAANTGSVPVDFPVAKPNPSESFTLSRSTAAKARAFERFASRRRRSTSRSVDDDGSVATFVSFSFAQAIDARGPHRGFRRRFRRDGSEPAGRARLRRRGLRRDRPTVPPRGLVRRVRVSVPIGGAPRGSGSDRSDSSARAIGFRGASSRVGREWKRVVYLREVFVEFERRDGVREVIDDDSRADSSERRARAGEGPWTSTGCRTSRRETSTLAAAMRRPVRPSENSRTTATASRQ